MELLLVRHAAPVADVRDDGGVADPGLSPAGRRQAVALAGRLAGEGVDAVVASTARRAAETATPLAAALGVATDLRPALVEYDFGGSAYVPAEEATGEEAAWEAWRVWQDPVDPDGPVAAFRRRVADDLAEVAAANTGRRVAVVCHGGTINAAVGELLGSDRAWVFLPHYVGITRVLVDRDGRRTLLSVNEHEHVAGLLRP